MAWGSNSLESINAQFRSVMETMGIDEEKQHRLAAKLNLAKKVRTITAMQTLDERKRRMREHVARLGERSSMLSLLGVQSLLETGPRGVFDVFAAERGHEVLARCLGRMDESMCDLVCEVILGVMERYGNGFPPFLRSLLDCFVEGLIHCYEPFFRIVGMLVQEGRAEELFLGVDLDRCMCNTYFSRIVGHVMGLERVGEELGFLVPLLKSSHASYVRYILFVADFRQIEPRAANRDVFDEIVREIQPGRTGCRTKRIEEIVRIADAKNVLDAVCCVVETFVFGNRSVFAELGKEEADAVESRRCAEALEERIKNVVAVEQGEKAVKAKVVKKIVKKVAKTAGPSKSYMQVKWTKMARGNSVWKTVPADMEGLFEAQDFDVFERKEVKTVVCEQRTPMIFSEKKNYAINIVLGRVRISNEELKRRILDLEDLDENLVRQLLLYFPSDEEVEQLQQVENVFGRGEEFFKECIDDAEMLKKCLYYLHFAKLFRTEGIGQSLELLKRYYEMLLTSSSLRRVLGAVLAVGNHLNQGTFLGNAEGFAMESIPRILEMKGIVDLIRKRIDCGGVAEDLETVSEAGSISFEGLSAEMEELKRNYANADGGGGRIQERMDEILPRYEQICTAYDEVVELHRECGMCFGESVNEEFSSRMMLLLGRLRNV